MKDHIDITEMIHGVTNINLAKDRQGPIIATGTIVGVPPIANHLNL